MMHVTYTGTCLRLAVDCVGLNVCDPFCPGVVMTYLCGVSAYEFPVFADSVEQQEYNCF